MKRKYIIYNLIYAAAFILMILLDRVTKQLAKTTLVKGEIDVIPNIFSLHYLENRGAAWGMLQNAIWLFIIITVVVVCAMLYFYCRIPLDSKYTILRISIIMLSAGAIGNFIDRIMWRYVVDFLYFKWINFPVFNIADCYVCISAVLLFYCLLFKYKDEDFFGKRKNTD